MVGPELKRFEAVGDEGGDQSDHHCTHRGRGTPGVVGTEDLPQDESSAGSGGQSARTDGREEGVHSDEVLARGHVWQSRREPGRHETTRAGHRQGGDEDAGVAGSGGDHDRHEAHQHRSQDVGPHEHRASIPMVEEGAGERADHRVGEK